MGPEVDLGGAKDALTVTSERLDDVPLLIGVMQRLGLAEVIDRECPRHGLQQGLSTGQLIVVWLAYQLSEGDHRKSAVRAWSIELSATLGLQLGQPLREVDCSDDRLGAVLRRLSDTSRWERIEAALWDAQVRVYALHPRTIRCDSTTGMGYHQVREGALMQRGHSKDHRPDLPQLKLMAANDGESGQLVACDVLPGQRADDQLYTPLIKRVRAIVGQSGLVYAGDCKMSALGTRAELVAYQDFYLTALGPKGADASERAGWLERALGSGQEAIELKDGERPLGSGYAFTRHLRASVDGQPVDWTERVLLVHSLALAARQIASLEDRLGRATTALERLTPPPGRGRRQLRDERSVLAASDAVLAKFRVTGLLRVTWTREDVVRGRGEPIPRFVVAPVERDEAAIAEAVRRLGWRVLVTNAPEERLSFAEAVLLYRDGWTLERDFHLLKDRPLGLSPLFVWRDDQIIGLTRLLRLAARVLLLVELAVRQALAQKQHELTGLYDHQPSRATSRPTGTRLLRAFASARLSRTRIQIGPTTFWHVTPLSPLLVRILTYLSLSPTLYSGLARST